MAGPTSHPPVLSLRVTANILPKGWPSPSEGCRPPGEEQESQAGLGSWLSLLGMKVFCRTNAVVPCLSPSVLFVNTLPPVELRTL